MLPFPSLPAPPTTFAFSILKSPGGKVPAIAARRQVRQTILLSSGWNRLGVALGLCNGPIGEERVGARIAL